MKKGPSMSRTTVAAVCLGILLLLIAGIAGTRCGDGLQRHEPVVIVDTVKTPPDSAKTRQPRTKKAKKKKAAPQAVPPRQRNYRDETVS